MRYWIMIGATILLSMSLAGSTNGQDRSAIRFGDDGNDMVFDVIRTLDDGYAILGSIDNLGPFIAKLNAESELEWMTTYDGVSEIGDIVEVPGIGFAVTGNAFIVMFDHDGNFSWGLSIDGAYFQSLIWTSSSHLIAAGVCSYGFVLADVEISGAGLIRTRIIGNQHNESFRDFTELSDGRLALVGSSLDMNVFRHDQVLVIVDSAWNLQTYRWVREISAPYPDYDLFPEQIVQAANGAIWVTGAAWHMSSWPFRWHSLVTVYDTSGSLITIKYCTTNSLNVGLSLTPMPDGGMLLVGAMKDYDTDPTSDIYLCRLLPGIDTKWSSIIRGEDADPFGLFPPGNLFPQADDGYKHIGHISGFDSGTDILIANLDSSGIGCITEPFGITIDGSFGYMTSWYEPVVTDTVLTSIPFSPNVESVWFDYEHVCPECGDADGSGGVDIDDVVYLINYIFAGGPAPVPLESGDADCSGGVDIDDVVYLIQYIFAGGPAPCDPDGDGVPDC